MLLEANKCLLCKNARCKSACPIVTEVPTIIQMYKDGKIEEAGRILFENNPLSAITALVCPHDDQCRGSCVKGIKGEPVRFHDIEYEISKKFLENYETEPVKKNGKRIAIVGSGPAGLTIAFELAKKGYNVTIFEKNERTGGVLRYGIPEFRISRELIDLFEKKLKAMGVKIRINTVIGPAITIEKLFEDGYEAVFIGTGVWNPRTLNIKGESFGHVHYAINYLRSPHLYDLGKKVVVIGAGNVAMDAARSAKMFGSEEVTIAFREEFKDMTATKTEIHETIEAGVKFDLYKAPVEIKDEGIILAEVKKSKDENGNIMFENIPGTEKLYPCDSVIIAISQMPRNTIVTTSKGLETHRGGLLMTDDNGETTYKGVFACGDVTQGGRTVIEAVVAAQKVAESIHNYCNNK
jgi:glutamate synthase (NADPH/NADH) small chain